MKLKDLMVVNEIFNSTVNIKWFEDGSKLEGHFSVDDQVYVIQLEFAIYNFDSVDYQLLNVAFYRDGSGLEGDDSDPYGLTNDTKNPAKVLGAIINGVAEKTKRIHVDALIFAAANNVEKRMKFYNKVAARFVKGFSTMIRDVSGATGKFTILLSDSIPRQLRKRVVDFVAEKNQDK